MQFTLKIHDESFVAVVLFPSTEGCISLYIFHHEKIDAKGITECTISFLTRGMVSHYNKYI